MFHPSARPSILRFTFAELATKAAGTRDVLHACLVVNSRAEKRRRGAVIDAVVVSGEIEIATSPKTVKRGVNLRKRRDNRTDNKRLSVTAEDMRPRRTCEKRV